MHRLGTRMPQAMQEYRRKVGSGAGDPSWRVEGRAPLGDTGRVSMRWGNAPGVRAFVRSHPTTGATQTAPPSDHRPRWRRHALRTGTTLSLATFDSYRASPRSIAPTRRSFGCSSRASAVPTRSNAADASAAEPIAIR